MDIFAPGPPVKFGGGNCMGGGADKFAIGGANSMINL